MNFRKYDNFRAREPYYSGYRLLSLMDRDGRRPEIYVSTTNRSAGKTVFFNGYCVHRFVQKKEKFLLLYRNKFEVEDCATNFFAEIGPLFFPGLSLSQETGIRLVYDRLILEGPDGAECCGYATSLRASEAIKKRSAMMADCSRILFDEAFPEDDKYLPDEMQRFFSIHDSLARGGGSQARYLPVYVVGNLVNIFNPYYETFGIVDNLKPETNFMRGRGFIVEQGYNESSAKAHEDSAFHRAMGSSDYKKMTLEKTYLNTSYEFINNVLIDCGLYICSISYHNVTYSVRYNEEMNIFYVSTTPDPSFRLIHAATEEDISERAIYDPTARHRYLLKKRYRQGAVKFKNLQCREAALHFMMGR